jgi:molecular chaperone DnaK
VKQALETDDLDAITRTAEALATVSQKMGQAIYAASAEAEATGDGSGAEDATSSDDDVVDAEIVDEAPESDGSAA